MNAELAKAAFAAKVNEWFPVAYTLDGGAVIARVAEVVTPSDEDWKTAAPQITDAVLNAKREQMFRGFLSLLRSNAKIELKRRFWRIRAKYIPMLSIKRGHPRMASFY